MAQDECATDQLHNYLLQTSPEYAEQKKAADAEWFEYISRSKNKQVITGSDTVYEIPTVVHIIHTGQPIGSQSNPTDQKVADYLNYTNKLLEANHPSVPDTNNGGVRIPVRFVLAKVDPDCNPTNGIVRVNASSISSYVSNGIDQYGGNHDEILALSNWSNREYANIYIVKSINPALGGFARYPWANQPYQDAIVINASSSIYQNSTTLAHEIGHFLGLYHTFEGDNNGNKCPDNNNCATDGDKICDTEPDKRYPDCSLSINPCTGVAYNGVRENYMNYTSCTRGVFTKGQRDKIIHDLKTYREGLITSTATSASFANPVVAANCIPTFNINGAPGGPEEVVFNDIHNVTHKYFYDHKRGYIDYSCRYRTELNAGQAYPLTVTAGISSNYHITVYVDYDNNGTFDTKDEVLHDDAGLGTWSVSTPVNGVVFDAPLRMRVMIDKEDFAQLLPCKLIENGQAEDYSVIIRKPTDISHSINNENLGVKVYPNPATNRLRITSSVKEGVVSIYNLLGERIYSRSFTGNENVIDISGFSSGVYIIKVISENKVATTQFTKQ